MKKIAIFVGYYLPHTGGVERYTYNLAKELKKQNNEVIIITTQTEKELKEKETLEYATIYRLPIYSIFSSRYPIPKRNKQYRRVMKQLKEEKIDSIILNTRFHLTSLVGAKFAKKQEIPACVIEHGSTHFTVYNKILDKLGHWYEHQLTNKMKTLVHDYYGVSLKCNEWLSHFDIQAKGVFYNCINEAEYETYNTAKYKACKQDNIILSYVGRMIKEKGILEIIEAYEQLEEKEKIQLILAGDGPLLKELESRELNENILLTGRLNHEEIMALLNQTDIFIHPSSFAEGMPTSILEAGLMKCAVIATPAGGTAEVINQKELGIICNPTVESIKESIDYYLQKEEKRKEAGEKLHKRIKENFTWNGMAKQIEKSIKYK